MCEGWASRPQVMGTLSVVLCAHQAEVKLLVCGACGVCREPWSTTEKPTFCSSPLLLSIRRV